MSTNDTSILFLSHQIVLKTSKILVPPRISKSGQNQVPVLSRVAALTYVVVILDSGGESELSLATVPVGMLMTDCDTEYKSYDQMYTING